MTADQQLVQPVYLGDAVYASFDGYQIWLHLNDHRSQGVVALEPSVYASLRRFAKRIWANEPKACPACDGESPCLVCGRCGWPFLIPRCTKCGLARHKRSCEQAAEALGKARDMLDGAAERHETF